MIAYCKLCDQAIKGRRLEHMKDRHPELYQHVDEGAHEVFGRIVCKCGAFHTGNSIHDFARHVQAKHVARRRGGGGGGGLRPCRLCRALYRNGELDKHLQAAHPELYAHIESVVSGRIRCKCGFVANKSSGFVAHVRDYHQGDTAGEEMAPEKATCGDGHVLAFDRWYRDKPSAQDAAMRMKAEAPNDLRVIGLAESRFGSWGILYTAAQRLSQPWHVLSGNRRVVEMVMAEDIGLEEAGGSVVSVVPTIEMAPGPQVQQPADGNTGNAAIIALLDHAYTEIVSLRERLASAETRIKDRCEANQALQGKVVDLQRLLGEDARSRY